MVFVLKFKLFGMPVTVRPSFLLIAALIGLGGAPEVSRTVAWVAIAFFSILIHELGHAVTARRYGAPVAIELNGLGGLTRWALPPDEVTPGRRALIAAAGSAVGVLFGGMVWLVGSQTGPHVGLTAFVLRNLVFVNLFWGLLNWLPIRPLDGGHLLESLLAKIAPDRADGIAKVVFAITAGVAAGLALYFNLIFVAILAGWLFISEVTAGRSDRPQPAPGPPAPSALDYDWTGDDDPAAENLDG